MLRVMKKNKAVRGQRETGVGATILYNKNPATITV